MSGHGTVLTGDDGQGNANVYVISNGGSGNYQQGSILAAYNDSGSSLSEGQLAEITWDANNDRLSVIKLAVRGSGTVTSAGDKVNVNSSGNTGLSGKVNISSNYGNNQGYGGMSVTFANVNGEASYLSQA